MADAKKTKLEMVIETVDKSTAKLNAINERLEKLTKPVNDFKEALGNVRENSGLDQVLDGFKGVGSAIGDLLGKVALFAGAVGLAVAAVLGLVSSFDDLGDKAEAMGVSVDFLAQMRYAAERSGASVEQLDQSMSSFTKNLGLARAGTGLMTKFLGRVSPALLQQVKAAKSSEEAFYLLADAAAKIEDPAKRAAFAAKTLGDASLAPLLGKGSKGVKELADRYLHLAGSQEEAAKAAGVTDDALKDFKATTDGAKAAIVAGLAPALTIIVNQLSEWFSKHRVDLQEWAAAIGKKLPAAFNTLVGVVESVIDTVRPFVDSASKLKFLGIAVAAVITGPLISALASLGIALLTTPIGPFIAAVGALALAWYVVITHWDELTAWWDGFWGGLKEKTHGAIEVLKVLLIPLTGLPLLVISAWGTITDFFSKLWDGVTFVFQKAWDVIGGIVDKVTGAVDTVVGAYDTVKDFVTGDDSGGPNILGVATNAIAAGAIKQSAKVTVDFKNAPPGMRANTDPKSTAEVETSTGYQLNPGGY